jgi:organic hydroperoxide reductase OsmC/OhrA
VHISALVKNARGSHDVNVATAGSTQGLSIPCRQEGFGSSINGGEFLMLALATCYCNDLYREAARLGISIESCEVEASADFEGVGLAAKNIQYRARVASSASDAELARLLRETDAVAEIHNTLRAGVPVRLEAWGTGGAV